MKKKKTISPKLQKDERFKHNVRITPSIINQAIIRIGNNIFVYHRELSDVIQAWLNLSNNRKNCTEQQRESWISMITSLDEESVYLGLMLIKKHFRL